jgi:xylulokinase
VTGISQELPEQTIGAAYGDALLAARAAGLAGEDAHWTRISDVVEPEEKNRVLYDELYGPYRELYPATKEHMHALARMQRKERTDCI